MSERRLFQFNGGVRLDSCKDDIAALPSRRLPVPGKLVLPLRQHVGIAARPRVAVGERVMQGQVIADAENYVGMRLHAPADALVSAIRECPVIHPSGLLAPAIELSVDPDFVPEVPATVQEPDDLTADEIFERIAAAGIVGLGGAGFPSHVKVREGATQAVDLLIINAVECEPYICCDDRIACEQPEQIVAGAALLARAMKARECVVAVEDDMPGAYRALADAAHAPVDVVTVPTVYPAGGEKQLITVLTGREVPSGSLPIHIGVAVLNVQTVYAIYRAVSAGTPLTERMITVAGDIDGAGNFNVLIGTPVRHVLQHTGAWPLQQRSVVSGGPMMGTVVSDVEAPVTKTVNCLLVRDDSRPARPPLSCIRCGDCIPVCPVGLNPQQLFEAVRTADFDTAQDHHLFDCIDCGCCAYVCPSRIPLVQHYRYAKSGIEALDRDRIEADRARENYLARIRRLAAAGTDAEAIVELADLDGLSDDALKRGLDEAVARARRKSESSPDE